MVQKGNWIDRYQASDHHTDRLVRTVVGYQDKTGDMYPFPEPRHIKGLYPSMARGRGGDYDSDVVYVTTSRRKVYPEQISDFDPISSSRKASRITAGAYEDSECLSTRSRRQDQALLNDITSRLVNADFTQPVNVMRRSGYTAVPHAGSRRILVIPSSPPMSRRRVAATPPPTRRSLAATTHAARARRAMSVPPMSAHSSVEFDFPEYRPNVEFDIPMYRLPPRRITTVKGRHRAGSEPPLPPTADLAVRNAKRYLNRIEHELGMDSSPVVVPVSTPRYRAASVPRHVGHVTGRPPLPRRIPGSPAAPRRHMHRHYLEVDDEPIIPRYAAPLVRPPASYSSLRSKTMEARNKLDHTRSLLDRYLPLPLGPENDVQYEVDFKFGELAARMPSLEAYRSGTRDHFRPSGYVEPYKPATMKRGGGSSGVSYELRNPPPRPRMSDARKRAREVLCKTKRDPTYFSY